MAPPAEEKTYYSFEDYLAWEEGEHIEILNGEVVMMAPPSAKHQEISGELFRQIANFLEGKKCRVYAAPFAVRLFEGEDDAPEDVQTVVEPDLSIICDRSKLDDKGCKGAPDMVLEVLSPSTRRHDRLVKLNLYQQAGVPEYWIVDPENRSVQVFLRSADGYLLPYEDYGRKDIAKVHALEGCFIELEKVFPEK